MLKLLAPRTRETLSSRDVPFLMLPEGVFSSTGIYGFMQCYNNATTQQLLGYTCKEVGQCAVSHPWQEARSTAPVTASSGHQKRIGHRGEENGRVNEEI